MRDRRKGEPVVSPRPQAQPSTTATIVRNRPVRWSWLLLAAATVGIIVFTVHSPIDSISLELAPQNTQSVHCTAYLTAGDRIPIDAGPLACAFDPIDDFMYCGTTSGEIVRVSTERRMVMERWKVTDGQVTGLSFLTHKLGTPANGTVPLDAAER